MTTPLAKTQPKHRFGFATGIVARAGPMHRG